jgi:hypothetical protein
MILDIYKKNIFPTNVFFKTNGKRRRDKQKTY